MHRDDLRILLLQIREDEISITEEFMEFVRYSDLAPEQFSQLNTYRCPDFDPNMVDEFDGLFVGGSSDASVLYPDQFSFVIHCRAMLKRCYQRHIPVFASCFGFQLAVEELGGSVILDKENMEMGIYTIELTDEAVNDPLFYDCPRSFAAVSGHKERAQSLPEEAVLLAYSKACPYHAFKLKGRPFYGFQFHPEVDLPILNKRLIRYHDRYFDNNRQPNLINKISSTNEANGLVAKFIDRIILAR